MHRSAAFHVSACLAKTHPVTKSYKSTQNKGQIKTLDQHEEYVNSFVAVSILTHANLTTPDHTHKIMKQGVHKRTIGKRID
jgi:hypothetical protein